MSSSNTASLLQAIEHMSPQQLKRVLVEHLTQQKLGLYWESNAIERDKSLNANVVLPRVVADWSHALDGDAATLGTGNLVVEGDNFDSLRLLRSTHAGKVRVIYIDPPYNTGNKDWVYNDRFVGANDRYRHSQWLEFLYQRLSLARDLLTPDGVILVSINDENRARLELLMEEVFPGRRVGSFVWRSRTGGNDAKGAFFSDNHEHVLVFGNSQFSFRGEEKTYTIYTHEENGRAFYLSDLTSPKDLRERPNTFYPIHDPETDVWYPCSPGRVWAYASKTEMKNRFGVDHQAFEDAMAGLRGETIEDMIDAKAVWFPPDQRVSKFNDLSELQAALDSADVPFSGSTPLLGKNTPNIEFWIGKKIGYGRPRLKKFKDSLRTENTPISSWLTPKQEQATVDVAQNMPIVGATEEGSRVLKEIMGEKVFAYPKPLSLIQNLLQQATRPGDTVLDFFAGSGTTGHAVLNLNAEQPNEPPRKFILCSSTEATAKEPAKNLCRDVCAERMRRVIAADPKHAGVGFAYVQLDKLSPADVLFDATAEHAFNLLTLRLAKVLRPLPCEGRGQADAADAAGVADTAAALPGVGAPGLFPIIQDQASGHATFLLHPVTAQGLRALAAWPLHQHPALGEARVFSNRPKLVAQALAELWQGAQRRVESLPLGRALRQGQVRPTPRRTSKTIATNAMNTGTDGQNDQKSVVEGLV